MQTVRQYGRPPFKVLVVHGGPGAGGEMAPVAREVASRCGVLEPIQTALSLDDQVDELHALIERCGDAPVVLVGFSWGAWLSYITAAAHPRQVRKLVLVGSPPFEECYAAQVHETRLGRLDEGERQAFDTMTQALDDPAVEDADQLLTQLGALVGEADAYEAMMRLSDGTGHVGPSGAIFQKVWREAAQLRSSGDLLRLGREIRCPVIAIHGDYDPHPAAGVQGPLARVLEHFQFVLLEKCGHKPWIERWASDGFFKTLEEAIA